jgi:hypothetical protein
MGAITPLLCLHFPTFSISAVQKAYFPFYIHIIIPLFRTVCKPYCHFHPFAGKEKSPVFRQGIGIVLTKNAQQEACCAVFAATLWLKSA